MPYRNAMPRVLLFLPKMEEKPFLVAVAAIIVIGAVAILGRIFGWL